MRQNGLSAKCHGLVLLVVSLMVLTTKTASVDAFAIPPSVTRLSTSTSRLQLTGAELTPEMNAARADFFFWFVGASGAAGVARSSFPRMFQNVMEIRSFADTPPRDRDTSPMLGISPLCGYPRDLSEQAVMEVVKNKLSIEQIVSKYPVENNLWSKKGYLTYKAFQQANAKADPMAVRAVMDCFSQSTDTCDPRVATEKLERYQQDLGSFKSDLLYSKLVGWAAIVTLLGLLGLADIEAFTYAYDGWFPEWPGGRAWLEGGLFDSEIGLTSIPKYWL